MICRMLETIQQYEPAARTVATSNLHLTLKFLGTTPRSSIPAITETLDQIAGLTGGFSVLLEGCGAFPRLESPSVLWLGFRNNQPLQELIELAAVTEKELVHSGFAADDRRFQPHLTIARLKHRKSPSISSLIQKHARTSLGQLMVDHIELIESTLQPDGPVYTTIHRAELRSKAIQK